MDAVVLRDSATESRDDALPARLAAISAILVETVEEPTRRDLLQALRAGRQSCLEVLREASMGGVLDEDTYHRILAELLQIPRREGIDAAELYSPFMASIPIAFARGHTLIAMQPVNGTLRLILNDPCASPVAQHVGAVLGLPVTLELAPARVIERAINEAYSQQDADYALVLDSVVVPGGADREALGDADLLDSTSRAPIVQLVSLLLFEAVKKRASNVHVQPCDHCVQVRYRIDGVLYDHLELPSHLLDEIVSRVKVVGGMDIAEKRIPQDGRATVSVGERLIDLRISVIPTNHGERVVLRLLDKSARSYRLSELGMSDPDQSRFLSLVHKTHGIILVTGPTGSGKSTTLYATLQHLDTKEKNILTLEDPIEYQIKHISQMQVATRKGMTFATGLRAVLRQDPDIIMVGEIRDEETARMAVQSSLTGHLVFSTLHTNDAAGAVSRLLDLGIEPYLVASSLLGVVAQRLVRLVCPECSERKPMSTEAVYSLQLGAEFAPSQVPYACGCDGCAGTGYRGRQGTFELLVVDETVRELIMHRAKATAIKAHATRCGMSTLRQDGIRKMLAGETTAEEVLRTSVDDDLAGAVLSAGTYQERS